MSLKEWRQQIQVLERQSDFTTVKAAEILVEDDPDAAFLLQRWALKSDTGRNPKADQEFLDDLFTTLQGITENVELALDLERRARRAEAATAPDEHEQGVPA